MKVRDGFTNPRITIILGSNMEKAILFHLKGKQPLKVEHIITLNEKTLEGMSQWFKNISNH